MKKTITLGAFALFAVVALSSCKKDYECTYTYGGASYSDQYTNLTKTQAKAFELDCISDGGTWSKR